MKTLDGAAVTVGVGVTAFTLFGFTLQEWVYILTIITLTVNLGVKGYELVKKWWT